MVRFILRLVLLALLILVLAPGGLRIAAALRETKTVEAALAPHSHWASKGAFADHYIQTPSTRFFTLSAGLATDPPVLLAHGTAAWSGFWAREVDLLGDAGFHTIPFDMPPFGFSSRAADRDHSRRRQADRILELVAALPAKPIIVAHSFGAAAVTEAVLRKPDAFKALIIVGGALGMSDAPATATLPLLWLPPLMQDVSDVKEV